MAAQNNAFLRYDGYRPCSSVVRQATGVMEWQTGQIHGLSASAGRGA